MAFSTLTFLLQIITLCLGLLSTYTYSQHHYKAAFDHSRSNAVGQYSLSPAQTDSLSCQTDPKRLYFRARLVEAARARTKEDVVYNGAYKAIAFPMGDVPNSIGVCTDVVVRAYRAVGVDLQERVHKDMRENFGQYPSRWGLSKPDTNIDHRRVPNLQKYFERKGAKLEGDQYAPGDLLTWTLPGNLPHIGIVSSEKVPNTERYKIIHNVGAGPREEDFLTRYAVTGWYRYLPCQ